LPVVAVLATLAACAPLAEIRTIEPKLGAQHGAAPALHAAEENISQARSLQRPEPERALGLYLAAVESSIGELRRNPKNDLAVRDYNFALSRVFSVIHDARLDPWSHSLHVPAPQGGDYLLTNRPLPYAPWRAQDFEFIPADELDLRGRLVVSRVTRPGIGAALVAVQRNATPAAGKPFLLPRIYEAATAVAHFSGRRCKVEFLASSASETVMVSGRMLSAAADFTAPLVFGLSREHPEKEAMPGMLTPEKFANRVRLLRLQPYQSEKTPVVFVHGLQDTPVTWAPMINALLADPLVRRNYQFWVFNYPSGYPVPYSALLLRRQLRALDKAFPGHRRIVLVGHSMGGILSRLMISDSRGDETWRYFFGRSPAQTEMSAEARAMLTEALIFNPRPDIARVIFISTPHRGSEIAQGSIGRLASGLIHNSAEAVKFGPEVLQASVVQNDPGVMKLKRMPNSIDTLSPNDPWVKIMNTLPLAKTVPYHSIMGDRGRGDTPNSSDGVVPYWSSHLEGAESEKIVPSNHGANQTPQAIAEVLRILHEHVASSGSGTRPQPSLRGSKKRYDSTSALSAATVPF